MISDKISNFEFNSANLKKANEYIAMYPADKEASAVMPLLYLAQEQNNGHISRDAMEYIAKLLSMRLIRVYEIATSYTMFNIEPVGKFLIQICRTTPCWLCGSNEILSACTETLGLAIGETTEDKLFTLKEVECLGACVDAPVVQINNDYYQNLTASSMKELLIKLKKSASPDDSANA